MKTQQELREIFSQQGNLLSTDTLRRAGIHYQLLQKLIQDGLVESVRRGWYQWIADRVPSDAETLVRLFPDAVFCMHTALFHYGYTDRVPQAWHLAVSNVSNRKRFCLNYPLIHPHYWRSEIQQLGVTATEMDGVSVPMHNRDRVICDYLRFRRQIDREIFNKAIQAYLADEKKTLPIFCNMPTDSAADNTYPPLLSRGGHEKSRRICFGTAAQQG